MNEKIKPQNFDKSLPDAEYYGRLVQIVLGTIWIVGLYYIVASVVGYLIGVSAIANIWINLCLQPVLGGLNSLVRSNYRKFYRYIPIVVLIVIMVGGVVMAGFNLISTIWLIVAVITAGLLLGLREAVWVGIISLMLYGSLVWMIFKGIFTPVLPYKSISYELIMMSGLFVLMITLYFAHKLMMARQQRKTQTVLLTESLDYLESVLNAYNDGLIVLDEKMTITLVNPEVRKSAIGFGVTDELVGRNFYDLFAMFSDEVLENLDYVLKSGEPFSQTHSLTFPASGEVILETHVLPLIQKGEISGLVIGLRDRTDEIRTMQALEASEEKFRTLVENTFDDILILQDGFIRYVNQSEGVLFGLPREEVIGQPIHNFLPESERERINDEQYRRLMGEDVKNLYELTVLNGNGEELPAEISVGTIQYEGRPAIIVVGRDISERKAAELALKDYSATLESQVEERTRELEGAMEQLVRKEKLAILGQLAGSVGHDLRNPLGVINNAAYFLEQVISKESTTEHEYLGIIKQEVHMANHIVADLLNFARTRKPKKQPVQLSDLVSKVILDHPAPANIHVLNENLPDLPRLSIDPIQMQQVLGNLVDNAYQAMPEGGDLIIRGENDQDVVRLSITDTGVGISEENKHLLFEPLFTTKPNGVGLGLATSHNLVSLNGGELTVESEVGVGTTFTVLFALSQNMEAIVPGEKGTGADGVSI